MKRLAMTALAISIALGAITATPSAISAAAGGVYCGDSNYGPSGWHHPAGWYYVVLYSDASYHGSCIGLFASIANLTGFYDFDTGLSSWNDVVSSWKINAVDCHYSLANFIDAGYSQQAGPTHDSPSSGGFVWYQNDAVSSVQIWRQTTCGA